VENSLNCDANSLARLAQDSSHGSAMEASAAAIEAPLAVSQDPSY